MKALSCKMMENIPSLLELDGEEEVGGHLRPLYKVGHDYSYSLYYIVPFLFTI